MHLMSPRWKSTALVQSCRSGCSIECCVKVGLAQGEITQSCCLDSNLGLVAEHQRLHKKWNARHRSSPENLLPRLQAPNPVLGAWWLLPALSGGQQRRQGAELDALPRPLGSVLAAGCWVQAQCHSCEGLPLRVGLQGVPPWRTVRVCQLSDVHSAPHTCRWRQPSRVQPRPAPTTLGISALLTAIAVAFASDDQVCAGLPCKNIQHRAPGPVPQKMHHRHQHGHPKARQQQGTFA